MALLLSANVMSSPVVTEMSVPAVVFPLAKTSPNVSAGLLYFYHTEPLKIAQSPAAQELMPSSVVVPGTLTT